MSSTTLMLEEGDSHQNIEIKSYTPPAFLCDSTATPDDCSFVIDAQVQAHPDDLTCLRGGQIAQVVLGSLASPSAAFCGLTIMADNWQKQQALHVEAMRDMLVDGDKVRQLDVAVNITSSTGQLTPLIDIASLQVRMWLDVWAVVDCFLPCLFVW